MRSLQSWLATLERETAHPLEKLEDNPLYNPIRSTFEYRDFWGDVQAYNAERTDAILHSGCYVPRWYHAPSNELELVTGPDGVNRGYLRYALSIPAGSWIVAFWHQVITVAGQPPAFWLNVTDSGLNHKFFGNQMPENYFATHASNSPWLLDYPYPVVAPGVFLFEFWNPNIGQTVRCSMTVGVAEVSPDLLAEMQRSGASS